MALVAGVLAVVAAGIDAPRVAAQSVGGDSGPGGVTITIVEWEGDDLVHADGPAVDDGCSYGLALGPPGFVPDLSTVGPRPPDAELALLTCNGVAIGLIWVGPHNTVDLARAARDAARRWVQTVPVPQPVIRTSPPTRGLVGIDTWFWQVDPPPALTSDRVSAFGVDVDVRLVSSATTWAFGDGSTVVGSTGGPPPDPSDIRHTFIDGGAFPVSAEQRLQPAYRLAGSDWLELDPILVTSNTTYAVEEVQAVVVE